MQTILVPTDFSPLSYNTARYAIGFAKDISANKIILYNAFMPFIVDDAGLGNIIVDTSEDLRKISIDGLIKMRDTLQAEAPGLQIEYESDILPVESGIEEACEKYGPGFIVMGVSGLGSSIEEALGSNAVNIARKSKVPTLIVPPDVMYNGFKKFLLATDFKDVSATTPVDRIKQLVDDFGAQLDVLHIETGSSDSEEATANEKKVFDTLFSNYNPQYHFIENKNFAEAVNNFALENNADLVIVIPKKHNWFEGIFGHKHTKALAFHTSIPLMAIHA